MLFYIKSSTRNLHFLLSGASLIIFRVFVPIAIRIGLM
jgi:hypothetical protein